MLKRGSKPSIYDARLAELRFLSKRKQFSQGLINRAVFFVGEEIVVYTGLQCIFFTVSQTNVV